MTLFFCVFLNHDEGAIFTSESGAVLAYLQMQIGIALYLQAVFFCVHKREKQSRKIKPQYGTMMSPCVMSNHLFLILKLQLLDHN